MYALAMPISSRIAADMLSLCFWAKSPRILEERSATCWQTFANSSVSFWLPGCIPHDAIRAGGAPCLAGVVKIVQVGYRLAHGEESLVRIERPAKQQRQQLARATLVLVQLLLELSEAGLVMRFELRHTLVRAAERLAVRGQHEYVGRQLAITRDGIEEQTQRIALWIDRPDAHVGRNRREQHVARDDHVQRLAIERHMLRRVAVADDRAPAVFPDQDI